jgi:PEP-CTERM motif
VTNPGGEIRGQLTSVSVPEPSSFVLLGSGIIGFVLMLRRVAGSSAARQLINNIS